MLWKKFSAEDGTDALGVLESSLGGLTSEEARKRLSQHGKNQIEEEGFPLWKIFKRRLQSSFLYLLLFASGLSYFLGERLEAFLIFLFILVNVGLEMYQEYHSEKAVRLLRRYLVMHTRVKRDGKIVSIESGTVVPGDIVVLEVGDRLPADMRFLETSALELDESLMTGESMPVNKIDKRLSVPPTEMYGATNIGFAGTVVTAGRSVGVVFATGVETALGDIAHLTGETERETTFEKGIKQFSRFILKLVLSTLTFIFFANILIKGGNIDILELLIFSIALAVSVVPEALPVIITVALSRGSLRLAQKKVIVKRLSAIEDLGSIEVLCCDKTGTLTENSLSVSQVRAADNQNTKLCLKLAFAACLNVPDHRGKLHDAFDLSLWNALSEKERAEVQQWKRLDTVPFNPDRRRNSILIDTPEGQEIIVRGAPEEVLRLSRDIDAMTEKDVMRFVAEAGKKGERVLAVARRTLAPSVKDGKFALYHEEELEFVGIITFSDALKTTAKSTVKEALSLGVAVKILTGDSREVAGAVGHQVGLLKHPEDVITGKELDEMSEEKRRHAIFEGAVFARVSPQQKYSILKILQEKHEVGFLGEGINDVPVLKLANVGLVVESATDIAREAADVVLLERSLGTVVDGIREGRVIFANILKYLKVTLTSNFGNFYSVALASLFLPFVPLLPIQILLLNLLSDFPMIAIATDTVDAEELEKPKNYQVHQIVLMTTILGVVSSMFDFILFGAYFQVSPQALQTAWFLLSVITEIILIYSLRTRFSFFKAKHASFLLALFSGMVLCTVVALPFFPATREILHFTLPTETMLLFIGGLAVMYFIATEAVKRLYYKHFHLAEAPISPKKLLI